MGYTIFMDENGDAQGNYTLVALGTENNVTGKDKNFSEALKINRKLSMAPFSIC